MSERVNKFLLFLLISLTLRGLYIFMFHACYSFDLVSWNNVGEILMGGQNPYNLTTYLNWPPLWMQLIFFFKKISLATHWPFNDVVRAFLIIVESALASLLYATIIRFVASKNAAKFLIVGIAINPISIFQVCQHCNFDVLVGFWVLLAVYMLLRFQEQHEARFWLFACFALGMGALTKTVPLSLAPLLLLSIRKLRFSELVLGTAFLIVPIVLALSIVYVLGPTDVKAKVLGYRSVAGSFGFTGLFAYFKANGLLEVWPRVFEIVFGAAWLSLGLWLLWKDTLDKRQIVTIAAVILVAIPALGPGYGPQYAYWFLPLLILMFGWENNQTKIFLWIFFGAAVLTYTIEYGLDFPNFGAFFLSLVQTQKLLQLSQHLSSKTGETFLSLPLWILYLAFVFCFCARIGRKMIYDFKKILRRK